MRSNVRSIIIPWSVQILEHGAFEQCSNLSSVTLKEGVREIGPWCFRLCTSLTSIAIPDSVTVFEEHAFYECRNLTGYSINHATSRLQVIRPFAFAYTNVNSIAIPQSCYAINDQVFDYCPKLNNIHIYSTSISLFDRSITFSDAWAIGNIYFYNLTNPNEIRMQSRSIHYSSVTTIYVYVKNSSVANTITNVLKTHNVAKYRVNIF